MVPFPLLSHARVCAHVTAWDSCLASPCGRWGSGMVSAGELQDAPVLPDARR